VAQEQKDKEPESPTGFNGHRDMSLDEIAALHPGLAIIMPMVGNRWWNVYYAAKESNWQLATFQVREAISLMNKGVQTRPRYGEAIADYIEKDLAPVLAALGEKDFATFEKAFHEATDRANEYHEEFKKGYLVWKLPDHPNPQVDYTPRD